MPRDAAWAAQEAHQLGDPSLNRQVFNNNARDYALRNAVRFGELLNR